MKKLLNNKYILFSLVLLIGGLVGWFIKPSDPHGVTKLDYQDAKSSDHQVWTCSMHPQIRQNEPGNCPICGMKLIPLEGEGIGVDPMAVSMSPTAMQLASVETAIVGKTKPVKRLQLNGKVKEDERRIYTQSTHVPGRIEKLSVNFTGDFIRSGQVIAYVYSPELVTAQEELFEAQKISDIRPRLFEAAKEKLKNWKLTQGQIEEILKSGKPKETFPILSDVSGYVTKKMVSPGDYVRKGAGIYKVSDLSCVWILFDIYESELLWVKKGDRITYTIQSLPGQYFDEVISYIDPVIDPKTRVARARVEVINKDQRLKPEMFVSGTVSVSLPQKDNMPVIPKSAVMWTGKRSVVYVKSNTGTNIQFLMREVTLGPSLGNSYVVADGIEVGEEIAINGTFSIDAAAQLAGKPSMMNRTGGTNIAIHGHEMTVLETAESVYTTKIQQTLTPLYRAYLDMKNGLIKDDFEIAQKAGMRMKETLSEIEMSLFKGEPHEIWMKYDQEIGSHLERIAHFSYIEELRKAFQGISDGMIGLTNSFKPFGETLYVQHCPMVDDFNGAEWLSTEEEIRNPYFGSSMLTCGEVTTIINKQ